MDSLFEFLGHVLKFRKAFELLQQSVLFQLSLIIQGLVALCDSLLVFLKFLEFLLCLLCIFHPTLTALKVLHVFLGHRVLDEAVFTSALALGWGWFFLAGSLPQHHFCWVDGTPLAFRFALDHSWRTWIARCIKNWVV